MEWEVNELKHGKSPLKHYALNRKPSQKSFLLERKLNTSEHCFHDNHLNSYEHYEYTLKACNAEGCSQGAILKAMTLEQGTVDCNLKTSGHNGVLRGTCK